MRNSQEADFPLHEKQSRMEPWTECNEHCRWTDKRYNWLNVMNGTFVEPRLPSMSKSFGIPWSRKVWIAFQDDTEKLCNFSVTVLS